MNGIKLIIHEIEKQRNILEKKIKEIGDLYNPKIIMESQKLDSILNKYMKQIHKKHRPCHYYSN